jgi:predicted DNA-binding transcriptional regulator YafY
MTYRKFGQAEPYTIVVEPYAIKVFKQRWYLLAKTDQQPQPKVYALDRMEQLEETAEEFEFPKDFDTEAFFAECYGVMCATQCKAEKIVIRAYPPYTNYLRTLPLHHSQKELRSTPEYADFEFYLRPTFDFRQELFSQGDEVEVLEPATFREEMMETTRRILKRYREKG